MKTRAISAFMLERYRLGELSPGDKQAIEDALATDGDLRLSLQELDESDRELRLRYPAGALRLGANVRFSQRRFNRAKVAVAAAIAVCLCVPVLYLLRSGTFRNEFETGSPAERIKGQSLTGSELFVYVKENQELILPHQAVMEEGNTVQLAYTAPAGAEYYGVIFSVDGRSVVTMHYPYRRGQSSLLVSGKRTYLNEAYILDDAPDYEVFVFVVCDEPLNVEQVLQKAREAAEKAESAEMVKVMSEAIFDDCEVETVTLLKKLSVTQIK